MFGHNPKRPPETGDGSELQVVEIFPTLQGEGPFVGHPSVFVRLGGCNLACGFCDTEFEAFQAMTLEKILNSIDSEAGAVSPSPRGKGDAAAERPTIRPPHPNLPPQGGKAPPVALSSPMPICDLVVITGGEPLRQNIVPLCDALLAKGYRVQIETNGTLWRPLPEGVNIVCSPKVTDGKYHALRPDLLARVDALKFIVAADDDEYRDVGDVGQAEFNIPVYVQPMDVQDPARNQANTAHALALAQEHGYRLSLQTHKLLGIA